MKLYVKCRKTHLNFMSYAHDLTSVMKGVLISENPHKLVYKNKIYTPKDFNLSESEIDPNTIINIVVPDEWIIKNNSSNITRAKNQTSFSPYDDYTFVHEYENANKTQESDNSNYINMDTSMINSKVRNNLEKVYLEDQPKNRFRQYNVIPRTVDNTSNDIEAPVIKKLVNETHENNVETNSNIPNSRHKDNTNHKIYNLPSVKIYNPRVHIVESDNDNIHSLISHTESFDKNRKNEELFNHNHNKNQGTHNKNTIDKSKASKEYNKNTYENQQEKNYSGNALIDLDSYRENHHNPNKSKTKQINLLSGLEKTKPKQGKSITAQRNDNNYEHNDKQNKNIKTDKTTYVDLISKKFGLSKDQVQQGILNGKIIITDIGDTIRVKILNKDDERNTKKKPQFDDYELGKQIACELDDETIAKKQWETNNVIGFKAALDTELNMNNLKKYHQHQCDKEEEQYNCDEDDTNEINDKSLFKSMGNPKNTMYNRDNSPQNNIDINNMQLTPDEIKNILQAKAGCIIDGHLVTKKGLVPIIKEVGVASTVYNDNDIFF